MWSHGCWPGYPDQQLARRIIDPCYQQKDKPSRSLELNVHVIRSNSHFLLILYEIVRTVRSTALKTGSAATYDQV